MPQAFLQALFGDDTPRAWVTGFAEKHFAPSELKDKAAASNLAVHMWGGGIYSAKKMRPKPDANQYVAVSVFKPDAAGVIRRRKAHFDQMRCVMVDDIGEGQKFTPDKIKLPFTVTVETSPGNCQGWYALGAAD